VFAMLIGSCRESAVKETTGRRFNGRRWPRYGTVPRVSPTVSVSSQEQKPLSAAEVVAEDGGGGPVRGAL